MYSAQHCILKILELWREVVDKKEAFGALITDRFKAYGFSQPRAIDC